MTFKYVLNIFIIVLIFIFIFINKISINNLNTEINNINSRIDSIFDVLDLLITDNENMIQYLNKQEIQFIIENQMDMDQELSWLRQDIIRTQESVTDLKAMYHTNNYNTIGAIHGAE